MLLSKVILITYFLLFIFSLLFQNLKQKVILFLHHCFSKKIPAKKKSLIPYYTDSIVFYKIQGKQHTNKMGFPYSSFDSFIFLIYTYNTSFLFPARWWSYLHCIYLMNLSFLACYSVLPEMSGHCHLLLTLVNTILLPLSASGIFFLLIFMYVMVLPESEDVDFLGLPWGASFPDDVDVLPSVLAGCTWLLSLFSVSCFLVTNNVMNLRDSH